MSFTSPNGLSAAMGLGGNYFASLHGGGMSVRMPEDITTYATLPPERYTPTKAKPWQGIWCGDYSGHGCEFLVVLQPDKEDEQRLPSGMDYLREWFRGETRRGSDSSEASFASAQEEQVSTEAESSQNNVAVEDDRSEIVSTHDEILPDMTDVADAPTGRIEAIKLTGDMNIPRGEYSFIAPDIGHGGFVRVADEEIFKGARIVRSAGHLAQRGFRDGEYDFTSLIAFAFGPGTDFPAQIDTPLRSSS